MRILNNVFDLYKRFANQSYDINAETRVNELGAAGCAQLSPQRPARVE